MAAWRFFQGLRGEWRWYALDEAGRVEISSDRAFAELSACMLNAGHAGFAGGSYQVHARAEETIQSGGEARAPVAPILDAARLQPAQEQL